MPTRKKLFTTGCLQDMLTVHPQHGSDLMMPKHIMVARLCQVA